MVSSIFLSLFEDSALTILYCFILDEEQGGSTKTPDSLRPFLDLADEQFKDYGGRKVGDDSDDEPPTVSIKIETTTTVTHDR